MRLVRVGTAEVALQFEFVNGTGAPLTPDVLGIDQIERALLLADLPRGTAYEVLTAEGNSGRISESNGEVVAPDESVTVTAVFTAPPAETTALTVLVDGLLPVEVPVQPAGSAVLVDDPVLRGGQLSEPLVSPLMCSVTGPPDQKGNKPVEIRLPSDVLFAFASAELSPAARKAIAAVGDEVSASGGTVTIEGHTDAIGSEAANQQLSERRAAAVRAALQAELGGSFTYRSVGFDGEQTRRPEHETGWRRRPRRARAEPPGGDPRRRNGTGPPRDPGAAGDSQGSLRRRAHGRRRHPRTARRLPDGPDHGDQSDLGGDPPGSRQRSDTARLRARRRHARRPEGAAPARRLPHAQP
jgi:hypothetical protein